MAVTKIWKAKDSIADALAYIKNPAKTENGLYISGVNCNPETAEEEMRLVKRQYGKPDGVTAYHAYQAFAEGEVTEKEVHEIGVKLAEQMWAERFQVVVATHLDKKHYHNHFLINSVSFADGKKYRNNKALYQQLRQLSDELCQVYHLSVIQNPRYQNRSRARWEAEQGGKPVWRDVIREDIDLAICQSINMEDFYHQLTQMGYEIKQGKHLALSPPGKDGFIRLKSLNNPDYLPDGIRRRIAKNYDKSYGLRPVKKGTKKKVKRVKKPGRKLGRYRALYFRYLYDLGKLSSRSKRQRPHFLVKEQIVHLNAISRQTKLIVKYNINETEDLSRVENVLSLQIKALEQEREIRRRQLRRKQPEEQKEIAKEKVTKLTEQIRANRIDLKTCHAVRQKSQELTKLSQYISQETQTKPAPGKEVGKHERRGRSSRNAR